LRQFLKKIPVSENEKGIALVTVLMLSLLISLIVIALAYRADMFSLGSRDHVIKNQNVYTAEIGLNKVRYFMLNKDCIPPNWQVCMPGINENTFTNLSSLTKQIFNQNVELELGGKKIVLNSDNNISIDNQSYSYEILVRTTNIPKVVNVVINSKTPDKTGQATIDAGILFTKDISSEYKQFGQGGSRAGFAPESMGADSTTVSGSF